MKVDLGLSDNAKKSVAVALNKVLADTYVLALKTQNYHWNVVGPHFGALHKLFEEQYEAYYAAGDEIAERIRALGEPAPGSFREFGKLTDIPEATGGEDAELMINNLASDNDSIVKTMRKVQELAEENGDAETGDMMIARMEEHSKYAWMLRSHLE